MGSPPQVLVLDDEAKWLDLLGQRLKQSGIECHCMRLADEAVSFVKREAGIQVALIDQILYMPTEMAGGRADIKQPKQGEDVVRSIARSGQSIAIGMLTSWPEEEAIQAVRHIEDRMRLLSAKTRTEDEKEEYLRGLPGVKHVFHKHKYDSTPVAFFRDVEDFIRQQAEVVAVHRRQRRAMALIYAIQLPKDAYEALLDRLAGLHAEVLMSRGEAGTSLEREEEFARDHGKFLCASPRQLRSLGISSSDGLFGIAARAQRAGFYLRRSGDAELHDCGNVGPGVSQVLRVLAGKLALGDEPIISADEYSVTRKPPRDDETQAVPDVGLAVQDFAFGEPGDLHDEVPNYGTRIVQCDASRFRRIVDSARVKLVSWGFEGSDPKGGPLPSWTGGKEAYQAEFSVEVIFHHGDLNRSGSRRSPR